MKKILFSGAGLLILLALFLAFNVVNHGLFRGLRLDLTENGQFTLSEGTRRILEGLDEPVNVYFYYSQDVGQALPNINTYAQQIQDLLREYELRADGKLNLRVINPEPFSEEEDRAAAQGVQAVQIGEDKLYMGLAASNSIGASQVIPFLHPQRSSLLEYDLSKLIQGLNNPEKPVVGVLAHPAMPVAGHWNPALGGAVAPWQTYREAIQLFEVRDLQAPLSAIDADVDLLWVIHPKDVDPVTEYAIDQFLMRGGQLMVFVDPFAEAEPPPPGQHPLFARKLPKGSDLPTLFKAWGVDYRMDQVLLDRGMALTVRTPEGQTLAHPGILGLDGARIPGDDVVSAQLNRINLGYPGALRWQAPEGVTVTPLLRTSEQARLAPAEIVQGALDPAELYVPATEGEGSVQTLAVRLRGRLPSAFPDGPPAGVENPEHRGAAEQPASVILVADVDLLTDDYWVQKQDFMDQTLIRPFADNGDLVTNGLDHLTGSEDLISIRSRAVYARPFERVQALRLQAEQRFRAKEQELQARLDETEQQLAELRTSEDGQAVLLTPEQQQALERFQAEKLRIRKELREVRHQLDKDIEALGMRLKLANIGLVPLLVALFGTAVAALRHYRRKQAREAHRE